MTNKQKILHRKKARMTRVRKKIRGTEERPRLTVFRSNRRIYVQIINDDAHKTLCSSSDYDLKKATGTKTEIATQVGAAIAEKAKAAKITKLCFDRGPYRYHGRIKALLEAVREQGIEV